MQRKSTCRIYQNKQTIKIIQMKTTNDTDIAAYIWAMHNIPCIAYDINANEKLHDVISWHFDMSQDEFYDIYLSYKEPIKLSNSNCSIPKMLRLRKGMIRQAMQNQCDETTLNMFPGLLNMKNLTAS